MNPEQTPSPDPVVPDRWSRMPLNAPVWVCLCYGLLMFTLAMVTGTLAGAMMVLAACMFSFQFWTYACWRGLHKPPTREPARPDDGEN